MNDIIENVTALIDCVAAGISGSPQHIVLSGSRYPLAMACLGTDAFTGWPDQICGHIAASFCITRKRYSSQHFLDLRNLGRNEVKPYRTIDYPCGRYNRMLVK